MSNSGERRSGGLRFWDLEPDENGQAQASPGAYMSGETQAGEYGPADMGPDEPAPLEPHQLAAPVESTVAVESAAPVEPVEPAAPVEPAEPVSGDYRPPSRGEAAPGTADTAGYTDPHRPALPARLTALARLVQIGSPRSGPDGISDELLEDAVDLLGRAGERLRLSGAHTVVTLAGGTGSGKSSLFNVLAGADFSLVGVTRPQTSEPYACVWGMAGAGPLLDWLGIQRRHRYARASALDQGEKNLTGLLLLDLPDHDSVTAAASHEVDRLVELADLMIWVLDPQKYADAAVHSRYLVRLAGHSSVTTVLLNQADLLTAEQAEDCVHDLRRLLDGEGLHDVRVLVTSAVTGAGIEELKKLLVETVNARRAASERIEADIDALVAKFAIYAGRSVTVPEEAAVALTDAFAQAAGTTAVCDAMQSAREARAAGYLDWPVASLSHRLPGRNPARKMAPWNIAGQLQELAAGPREAQPAEIDNAITAFGSAVSAGLPVPWSRTVYVAARSRAEEIPRTLGAAVSESLPTEEHPPTWWRLVRTWQWLLIAAVLAGVAWMGAILAFGGGHVDGQVTSPLLDRLILLPWVALVIVALLLLGWLTAAGGMNLVILSAGKRRGRVVEAMRSRIDRVAREMVLMPVAQELSEHDRFRDELKIALGASGRPATVRWAPADASSGTSGTRPELPSGLDLAHHGRCGSHHHPVGTPSRPASPGTSRLANSVAGLVSAGRDAGAACDPRHARAVRADLQGHRRSADGAVRRVR